MNMLPEVLQTNRNRLAGVAACLLLSIHAAMVAWSAARQSPTIDEPVHLSSGIWNWTTGGRELNRGNPPLIDLIASAPITLLKPAVDWRRLQSTFLVAEDFYEANGSRSFWLTTVARWALVPFTVLGGYLCWHWAGQLFGTASALLALTMWCVCPFVIANAEIVTGDMGSTVLILAACYSFWRWLKSPDWTNAVATGFVWGLAELAKYVAVILYPLLPVLWLLSCVLGSRSITKSGIKRECVQLLGMILLSIYVINLGYGFDGTGTSLGSYKVFTQIFRDVESESWGDDGVGAFMSRIPMPFPDNYLRGLDEISNVAQAPARMYFGGTWKSGGWWDYYLAGLALKLPLGLLLIAEVAVFAAVLDRKYRVSIVDELAVLFPGVALLVFISTATSIQYLRYSLPIIPFFFIWGSRAALAFRHRNILVAGLVLVGVAWSALVTASIFPHSGSYFNETAGGPENGHDFLLESSIDWGQDALYLKEWLEDHPTATPFHLAYFGHCDPRLAHIDFRLPPTLSELQSDGADMLKPGWYAISVSLLRGYGWPVVPDGTGTTANILPSDYQYFRNFDPVVRVGYSINIYYLKDDDVQAIRDKHSRNKSAAVLREFARPRSQPDLR